MSRRTFCRACAKPYRGTGRVALVLGPRSSVKARVCPACVKRALLVVQSSADWRERIEAERQQLNAESRARWAARDVGDDGKPLPE